MLNPEVRLTEADYHRTFEKELINQYPVIDKYEKEVGFKLDPDTLENAAFVLANPVKVNPPNWQHGRVLYTTLCGYIKHSLEGRDNDINILDIGTAKGFSALCMYWACINIQVDRLVDWNIYSVDVIDPKGRIARNTICDVYGKLPTLHEILRPWKEAEKIHFIQSTGKTFLEHWMLNASKRIHFAFIDGKHKYEVVRDEARLLSMVQQKYDKIVFDDLQIPGVRKAFDEMRTWYHLSVLEAKPDRVYGIASRK